MKRIRTFIGAVFGVGAVAVGFAPAAAAADGPVRPDIVGGADATETYSFMASMQTVDGNQECGASLIKPDWLVTAAHCVAGKEPADWQFRLNSNDRTQGGEVVKADRFVIHPNYLGEAKPSDIALVHVEAPASAAPIAIATESPQPGSSFREIGWGQTCPEPGCGEAPVALQQLDTTVAEPTICQQEPTNNFDPATELCLDNQNGTASACYGDSGGPGLVKNGDKWVLVGATSRGRTPACTELPHIYTNVTTYTTWIDEQTGGNAPHARSPQH
ncbi:S1 family peptidase [Amycolatopsis sp. NPDC059021]|uniref:S1 family peptidase n=1 Tax=Amycolatopsis sp. NPDC059021 TaxID=3346704 RepID=UPI00366F9B23